MLELTIKDRRLIDMLKLLFKDKSFIKYVEQVLKAIQPLSATN
jgi:hypothetical protein